MRRCPSRLCRASLLESPPPHTRGFPLLTKSGGTLVLYMGVKTLPSIVQALLDAGMPSEMPVAAIQSGTQPRQRTITATLDTIVAKAAKENLAAPAIIVIGW